MIVYVEKPAEKGDDTRNLLQEREREKKKSTIFTVKDYVSAEERNRHLGMESGNA